MATDGQSTFSASIPFAQGLTVASGTFSAPGVSFIGDTNTGLFQPADNQFGIAVNGSVVMTATSSGVSFPLAVSFTGSPSITGNLTVNGNTTIGDGAGDTLTVNATGTFVPVQTFSAVPVVPDASWSNAKLANMATQTIKGRTTAGTGAPEDLTATQATAILNAVVGDSGSGGTKGLVPAPATGDAAAHKTLGAAGTWGYGEILARGTFSGVTRLEGRNITVAAGGTQYVATLSPAAPNSNYQVQITCRDSSPFAGYLTNNKTTTGFEFNTVEIGGTLGAPDEMYITVYG